MTSRPVREPVAAGTYYPSDPGELRSAVDRLLAEADCALEPDRQLKGVATPHAALSMSGSVAAPAFCCMKNRAIETVVLVGPDHYIGFEGIAVYPEGAFRSPLGEVEVDAELAGLLVEAGDGVVAAPEAHVREHALEVQLPFLQRVLPDARIVPVLTGFRSRRNVETLAKLLARLAERAEVCLLATTDLSHYHSRAKARELDGRLRELVRAFAPAILWDDLKEGRVEACGGDPLVAVMLGAGIAGAEASRILGYRDSGDADGNRDHVVGYLAAAFYRGGPAAGAEFRASETAYLPRTDSLVSTESR